MPVAGHQDGQCPRRRAGKDGTILRMPEQPAIPSHAAAHSAQSVAELRRIARERLAGHQNLTLLGVTALVNESYLRYADHLDTLQFDNAQAFLTYASKVMRSVVVDTLRERSAQRRGGDCEHVTLHTDMEALSADDEALAVDEALGLLAKVEPRLAQVVELRYFGGWSEAEVAQALDTTERCVRRDWEKARALLRTMLAHGS